MESEEANNRSSQGLPCASFRAVRTAQTQAAPGLAAGLTRGQRPVAKVPDGVGAWLIVAALTVGGAAVRLVVAGQPLFGDELSSFWVVSEHGLSEVVSVVHSNAELTPPLSFVLSWFTTQIGHAEELVRAPSLLAGVATIPLVYLLGLRTVGRPAALTAAALTALSPFMIYYSAEARAYAVLMLLIVCSTLAALRALDGGSRGWWVAYGLSSCLAMYTHYTCVFLLGAQFLWIVWTHAEARRAAFLANVGAFVLFLPWISGVRKDLTSPTSEVLSALTPFTPESVRIYVTHWAIGFPYPNEVPLREMPGLLALILLGLGILVGLAGVAGRWIRRREPAVGGDRRMVLLFMLAVSVPVGTAFLSLLGDNIIGIRNIAASWPAFALVLAALLARSGPRLRWVATGLALLSFVIASAKMLDDDFARSDHAASADFVEAQAGPGDVVIDATALISPGPYSTLDTTIETDLPLLRAGAPAQREAPFDFDDPIVSLAAAFKQASRVAPNGRVFYVSTDAADTPGFAQRQQALQAESTGLGYRRIGSRSFAGFVPAQVEIFEPLRRDAAAQRDPR